MSREIKFRAWDIDIKKFVHPPFFIDNIGLMYFSDAGRIGTLETSHYILQQFTGLKDKNGKEIFEGDIVKRIKQRWNYEKVKTNPNGDHYDYQTEISFIEYSGNGFWVNKEDFGYEGEDLWDWDKIEVIGNIHENPELLKQTECQTEK